MLWNEEVELTDCLLVFCVLVWAFSGIVQLYFYWSYFFGLARFHKPIMGGNPKAVSLIIAAKNEASNLSNNIPLLLQQEKVDFELIVVNDHSTDRTMEVLGRIRDHRLKVLNLTDGEGKKAAIKLGISRANHEQLVFTDADCTPKSTFWLSEMAAGFSAENQLILGHSSFYKSKGLLNGMQRFENLMVAIQYFSFAIKGNAYMGVGRNLAYTKDVFENSNSFQLHKTLCSGDDDLLVNEMANTVNVGIVLSKRAHTVSEAKKTWMGYFHQKRRQLQAGKHYKLQHKILLAALGMATLLFNTLTLILLYLSNNWPFILMTFGIILIIKSLLLNSLSKKLGENDLIPWAWFLEYVLIINLTIIGVSTWIWRVNRWK